VDAPVPFSPSSLHPGPARRPAQARLLGGPARRGALVEDPGPGAQPSSSGSRAASLPGAVSLATDLCRELSPGLEEKAPGHITACHYAPKAAAAGMSVPLLQVPLLQVNDLKKYFPVKGGLVQPAPINGSTRWTACPSRLCAVRPCLSSASPAAASRRSAAPSCDCSTSPPARWCWMASASTIFRPDRSPRCARPRAGGVPGSVLQSQSAACGVARYPGPSRSAISGLARSSAELEAKVSALMDTVRPANADALSRRPHEFSGGSAPAYLHRKGARGGTRTDRLRRGGSRRSTSSVKAQDSSTCCRICSGSSASHCSSSAMIWRSSSNMTHRVAVMYLGKIVEMAAQAANLHRAQAIPTPRALLSAVAGYRSRGRPARRSS